MLALRHHIYYFIHLDAGTSVGGIEGEQMRLREGFVGSRSSSKDD